MYTIKHAFGPASLVLPFILLTSCDMLGDQPANHTGAFNATAAVDTPPATAQVAEVLEADLKEKTALGVLAYDMAPLKEPSCQDARCQYDFAITFTRTDKQLPEAERKAVRAEDPLNPELMMHFQEPGYKHKSIMTFSYVKEEDTWKLAGKSGRPAN